MFIIVAKVREDNTVQKYNEAGSQAEASRKVAMLKKENGYSTAFYQPHPGASPEYWTVHDGRVVVDTERYNNDLFDSKLRQVRERRREELSSLDGDGLDAIRKAISAISSGGSLPEEYIAYASKVSAIKSKHQKPKKE